MAAADEWTKLSEEEDYDRRNTGYTSSRQAHCTMVGSTHILFQTKSTFQPLAAVDVHADMSRWIRAGQAARRREEEDSSSDSVSTSNSLVVSSLSVGAGPELQDLTPRKKSVHTRQAGGEDSK
eukprot:169566-Hanusia_phi.AAC.1